MKSNTFNATGFVKAVNVLRNVDFNTLSYEEFEKIKNKIKSILPTHMKNVTFTRSMSKSRGYEHTFYIMYNQKLWDSNFDISIDTLFRVNNIKVEKNESDGKMYIITALRAQSQGEPNDGKQF